LIIFCYSTIVLFIIFSKDSYTYSYKVKCRYYFCDMQIVIRSERFIPK